MVGIPDAEEHVRPGLTPMASHPTKRRRTYNVRLIKRTWPYSVQEIASLFRVHKNAVLRWLEEGLRANTDKRPYLIRGDELARFLSARQKGRKHECAAHQFFCFKCRAPREAYMGIVDIAIRSPTRFNIKSVCAECGIAMNKAQGIRNLQKMLASFHVQQLTGEHLLARTDPSVNSDLEAKT
jgi:hypothetical protein